MSLFDFFKKPDKKKQQNTAQQSGTDNPFSSPEQNKKRYEAAMDFLQFFQEKTPLLDGRPHAGTVLSVGARLAGTCLFRAINKKDVKPGVVVLSEEVNTAYPQLLNMFAYFCKENGTDVMAKPLVKDIPEQDKPLMDLAQIQTEYQNEYNRIMEKHGLDYLESARAGMVVCSMLFNYHCIKNKDIDPYVATGIVAMGVVEAAKTSPVSLNSETKTASFERGERTTEVADLVKTIAESSISGSGNRLFFGERDATVQKALDNDGKFVLVHPEVENKLKQGNIDPYTVYIAALIVEMQSKIDQIDFVGGDVDKLALQWNSKPEKNIPIHIRQMLWLKENAAKFGYQQSGNSWVLK